MIIFLYGPDTYRSRQQLKKMVDKFKVDRDPQGLNVACLDIEKVEPTEVLQQILATPFLAERRMVVLENLLLSKHKDLQEDILKRIKENRLPEENVIVFWEGEGKYRAKLPKDLLGVLSKEKFAQRFDEVVGLELANWIKKELTDRGGKISAQALRYLVDNNQDMWRLSHLIEQLCAYKGEKEIELGDVHKFLNEKADDSIFNLVDEIVGGNPKKLFKMIRQQYKKGENAQFIFAMLLRQFKILLQLRDLYDREDNPNSGEIAKRLGLHPFVVKKSLPLVRQYNMKDLESVYNRLLDMDMKTKTGGGNQAVLLDLLVGQICVK